MRIHPLPAVRRDELLAGVRAGYRWGEPGQTPIIAALDSEHGYLRFHGSPTEEGRAIQPLGLLLGMHLAAQGWSWGEAEDGAIAVLAPDGHRACRLADAVSGLLLRDETTFSWWLQRLQAGGSDLPGVVAVAP